MERQFATFYLGENLFGIDILLIREINRYLELTPVEHAPAHVRGLLNLRGQIITILDPAIKLGLPPRDIAAGMRCIILNTQQELGAKYRNVILSDGTSVDHVGLVVDRIGDMVKTGDDAIDPPPANLSGIDGRFFTGVVKLETGLVVILKTAEILK